MLVTQAMDTEISRELCVANPPKNAAQYVEGDDKKSSRATDPDIQHGAVKGFLRCLHHSGKGHSQQFQH